MPNAQELRQVIELTGILEELVETVRDESRDLERLTVQLAQQTSLRDESWGLSVHVSRLSALLRRIGDFRSELVGETSGS